MPKPNQNIPATGIQGEVALREAATGEFRAIVDMLRRALREKRPGHDDCWVDVQAVFADRVVLMKDGRLHSYPYTLADNNTIELGEPEEVIIDFQPVAARMAEAMNTHTPTDEQGPFIEAKDTTKGLKWRIRIIESGLSGNKNYYPDAVLREATPLFNKVRVFVKQDIEHLKGQGKSFKNLIGRIVNPVFIEGKKTDTGQIQGDLELLESAGDVPVKMLEAYTRNMADLFGFSIDAVGRAKVQGGKRVAQSMTKVDSVDLIIEPGAGGELINLIEAKQPEDDADMALRNRMIEAVKKANRGSLPEGLDVDNDEKLDAAYREAVAKETHTTTKKDPGSAGAGNGAAPANVVTQEDLAMIETRATMREAIAGCSLPDEAKAKLRKQFGDMDRFTEAQVNNAIKDEADYLAHFSESGHVGGAGAGRVETGEDRSEKVVKMFDAFFDPKDRSVQSFKECYTDITGDSRVTGHIRDCDVTRMREAFGPLAGQMAFREAISSGTFAEILGDAITRRMVADYRQPNRYDVWRHLITAPVPLSDFRTNHRTRMGGYGDLPTVAEDGAYGALTSPADEEATYSPAKKGGTETISLETIKNDDVGAIQRIPIALSRAAQRTLSKFVLDFLRTNPTIYDAVTLFHASHNNLGTLALSPAELSARRLAMMKQTEAGSLDPLGIPPVNLWLPPELEETGFDLFRLTTNNETDFVESLQMNVIPVWYWTDANDWAVTADPNDIPIIELGFMDGNEEPELFMQDNPTQGSLFSNDQIKYKIRHVYGGAVLDYRGAQKNVVV